jgi:hypothetical protein
MSNTQNDQVMSQSNHGGCLKVQGPCESEIVSKIACENQVQLDSGEIETLSGPSSGPRTCQWSVFGQIWSKWTINRINSTVNESEFIGSFNQLKWHLI